MEVTNNVKLWATVLIPAYRRPVQLQNCLRALGLQTRRPDEVIVVVREDDTAVTDAMKEVDCAICVRSVTVSVAGQVQALNVGLRNLNANTDIVCIIDDDTEPRPHWLERIETLFENYPRAAGIGGRDWIHQHGHIEDGSRSTVGKITWFGRIIGNHHLGVGTVRPVDILKGANMSFRYKMVQGIEFDARLRGTGAQVHNDREFSLALKSRGLLLYDPAVAVDHYPAPRFDEDVRGKFNVRAYVNSVFNDAYVIAKHFSWPRFMVWICWHYVFGTRHSPGVVQIVRLLLKERSFALRRWSLCMGASWDGIIEGRRVRRITAIFSHVSTESR